MPKIKFPKGQYSNAKAIENLINYIFNTNKTPNKIVGSTGVYPIERKRLIKEFIEVQTKYRNCKGRKIIHFIITFSEEESKRLEILDYQKIGYAVADYFDKQKHQVAFALHENKPNLHIHFAVNPVNYMSGKKYRLQYKENNILKELLNQLMYT